MQTLKALDLSANASSGVFGSLESSTRISVQVTWPATGTPVGVFTLMGTNEEGPTANFTAIGPIANPNGAAGSVIADFDAPRARYRVDYTRTSGTGSASVSPSFARTR